MFKKAFLKSAVCVGIAAAAWAQDTRLEIDKLGNDARNVPIQVDEQALIDDTNGVPAGKWIGVGCEQVSDALRAHVDLPEGIGLMVLQVMPKSPAFDAGIEKHDILVSAGDRKLGTNDDLVAAVGSAKDKPIEITWMHKGAKVTKMVTPVERPWEYRAPQVNKNRWARPGEGIGQAQKNGDLDNALGWLRQIQGGQGARQNFKFKVLGPGMHTHQSQSKVLPNGMEIHVEREGEGQAKVKVKQGKSSWETTEDKLDLLPDDARAEVESMLKNDGIQIQMRGFGDGPGAGDLEAIIQQQLKQQFQGIPNIDDLDIDVPWPRMNERFDEMNRQMEKMMERIEQLQQRKVPANEDDEA